MKLLLRRFWNLVIVRAAVGFAAGWVLAWWILIFFGVFHTHDDLSQWEIEQQDRARWIPPVAAWAFAACMMLIGKTRIPKVCLLFTLVFATLCFVPIGLKGNSLLPLGSCYLSGFRSWSVLVLAIHTCLALALTAALERWE